MPNIEAQFPDGRIERFELSKQSQTIGRSEEADIHIDLPVISRMHARIDRNDQGRWLIVDLGSRNGTRYDGRAIKSHVLTHHDVVEVAAVKIAFNDPSGKSDAPTHQTVYHRKMPRPGRRCPICKTPADDHVVVCVECGYDFRTGKRIKPNTLNSQ